MNMMSQNKYFYKLMVDDLPSATVIPKDRKQKAKEIVRAYESQDIFSILQLNMDVVYTEGLMVGAFDLYEKEFHVNNHLDITLEIHGGIGGDKFKIVGFDVEPKSIDWQGNPCN